MGWSTVLERSNMNKSTNLNIRISETDKEVLRKLAEKKQMSMAELVIYLIRREGERESAK